MLGSTLPKRQVNLTGTRSSILPIMLSVAGTQSGPLLISMTAVLIGTVSIRQQDLLGPGTLGGVVWVVCFGHCVLLTLLNIGHY